MHIHILPNGEVIVHSHPLPRPEKKGDDPGGSNHAHSDTEFALIKAINNIFRHLTFSILLILFLTLIVYFISSVYKERHGFSAYLYCNSYRAPPLSIII